MVMDRGFFSKGNIEEMVREKIPFIMPATMVLKSVGVQDYWILFLLSEERIGIKERVLLPPL